ncbi:MAG: ABC transporter permease [Candidatus Cloacimonetes bacterium]|nr:ABC transporter permease [Candidatus Cloacimonadota bacterium]
MAISIYESISLGFIDFWSRKVRSFITLLGIVLGTVSIIVILSIVNGMNAKTMEWMNETGGIKKISIWRNWMYQSPTNLPNYFTIREVDFIRENIPPVEAFNVAETDLKQLANGGNQMMGQVIGCLPDFIKIGKWEIDEGRSFNMHDYYESNNVIVLGSSAKNNLFGPKNAIGQYVTLSGLFGSGASNRLMVVGVLKERRMDSSIWSENPLEWLNRQSFIPVSTRLKTGGEDKLSNIEILCLDEKQPYTLKPILEDFILNMRKGQPVFRIESAIEDVEEMRESTKMFRIIFMFISAISLFVGGIVIMNIMLATIQERTREIGIRLAVGARQIDIFIQFLVQTVVVSFIGGALGVVLAVTIVDLVGGYLDMNTELDVTTVVVALTVSCVIGFFFGLYPAIKASKLDPVVALRNE